MNKPKQLTSITDFNKHDTKTTQSSVTPTGCGSFIMSADDKLHARGYNEHGQCRIWSNDNIYEQILISDLENKFTIDV